MSESISAEDGRRAPRVKLAGVVLALIQLENGRQIRSRLHQLSITGGLLYLDDPLDEGIKVEVMFHVGNCTVRSKAAMLSYRRPAAAPRLFSSIVAALVQTAQFEPGECELRIALQGIF